jgi:hypothetical protein
MMTYNAEKAVVVVSRVIMVMGYGCEREKYESSMRKVGVCAGV